MAFDFLDESHAISQDLETAEGSFWHALMHRREPDYGNAKYWFNRVGQHPAFSILNARLDSLQKEFSKVDLGAVLPAAGPWDPFRFIDACERTLSAGDRTKIHRMERIQQLEFQVLLEWFCGGDGLS